MEPYTYSYYNNSTKKTTNNQRESDGNMYKKENQK